MVCLCLLRLVTKYFVIISGYKRVQEMPLYTEHRTHNFFYCICICVIIELICFDWLLLASRKGFWIWEEYSLCSPVKRRLSVSPGTKIYGYMYSLQCTYYSLQQPHWSEKTAKWNLFRGKHRQTGSTTPRTVWHGCSRRNIGTTKRIEFVFWQESFGFFGSLSRVWRQGSVSKYC